MIKSLTVIDFKTDARLEFETKNHYNGLSVGSETVLFRLAPEGSGTLLVMTGKRSAHVSGPLHVLIMFLDSLKSVVSRPINNWNIQLIMGLDTAANRLALTGHWRIGRANPTRKTGLD